MRQRRANVKQPRSKFDLVRGEDCARIEGVAQAAAPQGQGSRTVPISLGWVKEPALVDTICSSELAAALGQP